MSITDLGIFLPFIERNCRRTKFHQSFVWRNADLKANFIDCFENCKWFYMLQTERTKNVQYHFFPLVFITISWQSYSLGAFYSRKWHTIDSAIESKWNRKIIYLKCNDRNGIMKTVIDSFHSHCTSIRTKLKYWSDAENWNLERLDNDAE